MITGICIHMGIQQLPRTILEICFVDPQIVWGLSQKRRQKRSKTTNSLTPLVPNAQSMDYAHQIYRYTDIQIYRYSPRNELFYFPSPRGLSMLRAWITHTAILYAKTKLCFSKRDLQRKHDDCLLIISLLQYARETYILVNQTYSSVQETHISVKETYTSVKATCISLSVKQSCISISYKRQQMTCIWQSYMRTAPKCEHTEQRPKYTCITHLNIISPNYICHLRPVFKCEHTEQRPNCLKKVWKGICGDRLARIVTMCNRDVYTSNKDLCISYRVSV